jgi:hypothetical protein
MLAVVAEQIVSRIAESFFIPRDCVWLISYLSQDTPGTSVLEPISADPWGTLVYDHWISPISALDSEPVANVENPIMINPFLGRLLHNEI